MQSAQIVRTGYVVTICFALTSLTCLGQAPAKTLELILNQTLEREITRGETHEYQVTLKAGEFMQVRVEQRGIDVVLSIHSAEGRLLATVDSPNGMHGFEILSITSDKPGRYLVRINRLDQTSNATSGRYTLTLSAKRTAVSKDAERLAAEKRFKEIYSNHLLTLEESRAQYQALSTAWRALDEKYWAMLILELVDSLESLEEASKLALEVADKRHAQELFERLGKEHSDFRAWDKSKVDYENALAIAKEREDDPAISRITPLLENVAEGAIYLAKLKAAQEMIVKAQRLSDSGSKREAIAEFSQALDYCQANKYLERTAVEIYEMIGQTYLDLKEGDHAKEAFRKALDYAREKDFVGYEIQYAENLERVNNELQIRSSQPEPIVQTGHTQRISTLCFSPDGNILASGGQDNKVKLWDVASGRELRTLSLHRSSIYSVTFSPDGKKLASASYDGTIMLWDVFTGIRIRTLTGHLDEVTSVAFSPNGSVVASGDSHGRIKLWNVTNGDLINTLERSSGIVWSIVFSPDGKTLASAGNDARITLWDISDLRNVRIGSEVPAHQRGVFCVRFRRDGVVLASSGMDGVIKLWNVAGMKEPLLISEIQAQSNNSLRYIRTIDFSPDGNELVNASNDGIKLWDVANPKMPQLIKVFSEGTYTDVDAVAFSPKRKLIAAGNGSGSIDLLSSQNLTRVKTLAKVSSEIRTVNLSSDLRLLSVGYLLADLHLWNLESGKRIGAYASVHWIWESINRARNFNEAWNVSAFSGDGKAFAVSKRDAIEVRTLDNNESYQIPTKQFTEVMNLSLSPKGEQLAALWHQRGKIGLTLWSVREARELPKPKERPEWLNFKAGFELKRINGKEILIYADEAVVKFIDLESGRRIASLYFLKGNDWAVVDADGRWDASDGAQNLMYYSVATPQGYEIIEFAQLRARYYEPDLLPKLLGYKKEPLRNVSEFKDVLLPPLVEPVGTNDPRSTVQQVKLKNRNGGIGRVQVIVDGQEVIEDARDEKLKANPQLSEYLLTFDLKNASFIPGEVPDVKVIAWNYDEKAQEQYKGYISSRGVNLKYLPPAGKIEPPTLYAIIGGVSDYKGGLIDLRFAAHDAESMYQAIKVGGKNLFGAERIKLKLLSTGGNPNAVAPTKDNFRQAFEEVAREARPNDILLVYLSGHGITLNSGASNYYYLTQDAVTNETETFSRDSRLLESSTISSEELIRWEKSVKAKKGLLILDTCAAGAIGSDFKILEKKEVSSDAKRAIADMSNRVGFYVLMGSAADSVSYEAGQYGQGVLTYALLQGMRGPALKDDFVDVSSLFDYAADTVPVLARNIGGIQRPEIRVPTNSTSFPFGLFKTNEDRSLIPYVSAKPQILRLDLQNQNKGYDDLRLTNLLRDRFHADDRSAVSRNASPEQIFLENVDEMPGAIKPSGNYKIEGEVVKVTINFLIDEQLATIVTLEGKRSDLGDLTERIFQAIRIESQKLNAQRSETQK